MNRLTKISAIAPLLLLAILATRPVTASQDDANRVEVTSGDTLFGIVRLHYPNLPSRWSLIENEIFLANPHAFSDNDKSLLRVGAILEMPVYDAPADTATRPEEPESAPALQNLVTVGTIIELSGSPLAIDINEQKRLLDLGGGIFIGDIILTEGDSAAHLEMSDGAELYVRTGSRLVIDNYSFVESAPQASRSVIRLLKGGFRTITGLIGQRNPGSVNIVTTDATIGVRGTDFAVRICGPDECSLPDYGVFEAGDYAGVLSGEIAIINAAGTTPVGLGEVVRTTSPDTPPVLVPEAAALIFSESELAILAAKNQQPMNFFQWLRSWIFRSDKD